MFGGVGVFAPSSGAASSLFTPMARCHIFSSSLAFLRPPSAYSLSQHTNPLPLLYVSFAMALESSVETCCSRAFYFVWHVLDGCPFYCIECTLYPCFLDASLCLSRKMRPFPVLSLFSPLVPCPIWRPSFSCRCLFFTTMAVNALDLSLSALQNCIQSELCVLCNHTLCTAVAAEHRL